MGAAAGKVPGPGSVGTGVAMLAVVVVLGGCAGHRAEQPPVSSCGYLYQVRAAGLTRELGQCSGSLPPDTRVTLRLRVGGSVTVTAMKETDGTAVAALPTSSDPRVLRLEARSGTYRAVAAGSVGLVARTALCNGPVIDGDPRCTALHVLVLPR